MRAFVRTVIVVMVCFAAHPASAAMLFDNFTQPGNQYSSGGNLLGGASNDQQGNAFVATTTAQSIVANVALSLGASTGNAVTASLFSDNAGLPGATSLGSVSLTGALLPLPGSIVSFAFDPALTLQQGLKYWLVLSGDAQTVFTWMDSFGAATSEPYRQGAGPWTANLGTPGAFSVSGTPVPLPAAGWLLVSGIGGLAAMRRRRRA